MDVSVVNDFKNYIAKVKTRKSNETQMHSNTELSMLSKVDTFPKCQRYFSSFRPRATVVFG